MTNNYITRYVNPYKGKAIYNPKGKAEEYSLWACNFYNGCSAKCTYCYNRREDRKEISGGDAPILKKSLVNEEIALQIFEDELLDNLPELQKHGLFFNFISDPFLPETKWLNQRAIYICQKYGVPVKTLTKQTGWIEGFMMDNTINKNLIASGFTLTGHDELEPGASPNQERINAMIKLHNAGYKTFASIEPVIDFKSSFQMIEQTLGYCDLYMIGLESKRVYDILEAKTFTHAVMEKIKQYPHAKVYWKDGINELSKIRNISHPQIVYRNYNIFNK